MDPKFAVQAMMICWSIIMFVILCTLLRFKKTRPDLYSKVGVLCDPLGGRRYLVLIAFLYLLPIAIPPQLIWVHLTSMFGFLALASPLVIKWMLFYKTKQVKNVK